MKSQLVKAEKRVPTWVMPLVKLGVFLMDALLVVLCFFLAFKTREGSEIFSKTAWAWSHEFVPYAGILYFAVAARLTMLIQQRVYRYHGAFSGTQDVIRIFKAVGVSSLLTVAWAFLFRGGFAFREFSYSRSVFVFEFLFALIGYTIFHTILRHIQAWFRNKDINLIPTLIVGTNDEALQTISELNERKDLGYRIIGVIGTANEEGRASAIETIGDMDSLPELIRTLEIQEVIITDNTIASEKLFEVMMGVGRKQKVEFRFAPGLFNLLPQKTSVEQLGVLPMVRLFREPLSDVERFVKRLFDIVSSIVAIILLSPLWLAAAIWIKLDSRGGIFFKQERVGMDGRIFLFYKFRSMEQDCDDRPHREAYHQNIEGVEMANAGDEETPVFGKVKNDWRITKAGKWLRRLSIDELPQLFNVLLGDMSIVGPRPPIPYEVEAYQTWHRKRLDMKPGISGLWQVSGRSRLSFDEMVKIDLYYIENWSMWLDLKIILQTIPAILRGDGAK